MAGIHTQNQLSSEIRNNIVSFRKIRDEIKYIQSDCNRGLRKIYVISMLDDSEIETNLLSLSRKRIPVESKFCCHFAEQIVDSYAVLTRNVLPLMQIIQECRKNKSLGQLGLQF